MNVLWTQVKKDVRSIRLILTVWLVIEVGLAVLVGSGVDARFLDDSTVRLMNTEHRIVMILATAIFALVAIALVQADRLVGTTSFWLTRPIGRSTLLASKVIVAVVFLVLVPLALDAIVFFASGVMPPALWRVAAERLGYQLVYLLPVMAIAALTPNIARFILACAVGVLAFVVFATTVNLRAVPGRPPGAVLAGGFASLALMAIACLGVIVHQYLTRRTRRSSFVAVAGIAGMLGVYATWPWPMDTSPPPAVDVRLFDPASVTLLVGADQLRLQEFTATSLLQADATLQDVPAGFQVRQACVRTTLRFTDGTLVRSDDRSRFAQSIGGGRRADMLRRALGPVRVVYSRPALPAPSSSLDLLRVDARTLKDHGHQVATCKADIVLGVWTDRVVAQVPARSGVRFGYGGFWQGDIVDVRLDQNGVTMRTRESGMLRRSDDVGSRYYVLLNRSRGEAIVGRATQTFVFWPTYPQVPSVGTLDVRHANVEFSTSYGEDRAFAPDQAWLDNATLVIIETALIGTFTRSIDFGDIVLGSLPRR